MMYRMLPLSVVALALFVSTPVLAIEKKNAAEDKQAEQANTHEGVVVSVTADTLTMKSKAKDGQQAKEYTHKVADAAKVICDGKACKLEDLKAGQKVRVTTKQGDQDTVVKVEALNKNEKFEKLDGKDSQKNDSDKK